MAVPVHVEEMTSEVTVVAGELPLTDAQLEKLVMLVLRRLEERQRDARRREDATRLRPTATPPSPTRQSR